MPNPTPRTLTHDGLTLTLQAWAKKTGINAETIRSRLDQQGYDVARALTTPTAKKFATRGAPPVPLPRPCPKLQHHAASNRACARWRTPRKENVRYFGPWGSKEAADGYKRFQIEWASAGAPRDRGPEVFVCELVAAYLEHVGRYYVKDGKPTSQQHAQRTALRVVLALYSELPVADFKPKHLKACQQAMVEKKWARRSINQHARSIARCFSWGVAEELVPASVADALAHVPRLQAGRSEAVDHEPVRSVPRAHIDAIIPHLHEQPAHRAVLAAMIEFQLLVGCRPGALCAMTADLIDTSGDVWTCRASNKNLHRLARREALPVFIGPRAQALLRPFLDAPGPGGRLWCVPPRWPDSPKAKRVPVSTNRYAQLVRLACRAAKVKAWHPHQLRHNRATEVQRLYESNRAAAAVIGDTEEVTRAVYVDPNEAVARRIAMATG